PGKVQNIRSRPARPCGHIAHTGTAYRRLVPGKIAGKRADPKPDTGHVHATRLDAPTTGRWHAPGGAQGHARAVTRVHSIDIPVSYHGYLRNTGRQRSGLGEEQSRNGNPAYRCTAHRVDVRQDIRSWAAWPDAVRVVGGDGLCRPGAERGVDQSGQWGRGVCNVRKPGYSL